MAENPILGVSSTIVGQDQQVPTDRPGYAEAAGNVVEAVATLKDRQLQGDLQAVTDDAIMAAQAGQMAAQQTPTSDVIAKAIGGSAEQVDDPENAAIRPVLESIAKLKLANEQGTINVDELKIRQENILRDAIARHPVFAGRFIQAAGQQLGYNPIGSTVDALGHRQSGAKVRTQADEIEDYYEKQGDLLNVDRTLKYSNPAAWYGKVQKEISFNENLQRRTREYQLRVATRQTTEEVALQDLRTNVVPSYSRKVVTDLLADSQRLVAMTPEQRANSLVKGELDQFRLKIQAARVGLVDHIRKMNGNLENFLSPQQIADATSQFTMMLDIAEKNTDPVAVLAGNKNFLESQIQTQIDFQFPEFGAYERFSRLLANFPDDSLVAKKFSEQTQSAFAASLANMFGAITNGRDPGNETPVSVIPPEAGGRLPPQDRAKVTREVVKRVQSNLDANQNDPFSRTAAMRTLSAFTTEYNTGLVSTGKAPDRETVMGFVDLAASDGFAKAVLDPNVQASLEARSLESFGQVITKEAFDLASQVGEDISVRTAPATPSQRAFSAYAPYDLNYNRENASSGRNVPLSEVVRVAWVDGGARFVAPDENDVVLLGSQIDSKRLATTIAQLNLKYAKDLTRMTRAVAHTSGTTDYVHAAVVIDNEFNNVRAMLP